MVRKTKLILKGRGIYRGIVKGEVLKSQLPLSFFGGVDPETGIIVEKGHPLEGKSIDGTILVFPYGKGSTVGSYIIYGLKKKGKAPLGIINKECDPIVAAGVIIAEIPAVDQIDIEKLDTGDVVLLNGESGEVEVE